MNTLRQLAYLIIDELTAGKPDTEMAYDEREIIMRLRMQLSELFKIQRLENRAEGSREIVPIYIYTYTDQTVNFPSATAKYCTVPVPDFYVNLPYNKGIYAVAPNNDIHDHYTRRRNQTITRRLKCGDLQGKMGWWSEGMTIYLSPPSRVPKTVAIKLVLPAPSAIGDNDPLPLTPELQAQLLRLVKADIQNMGIQDVYNDGNSVITNEQK